MGMQFRRAVAAVIGVLCATNPVLSAEPFKDFTFRTIKPPSAGAKKLITIQITPQNTSLPEAKAPENASQSDLTDWFWAEISPELGASGPGRFQNALHVLLNPPEALAVQTPRITRYRQIVMDHGRQILLSTIGTKVSPALVLSMIAAQSSEEQDSQSKVGALGLMQLKPAIAERFGVTDPTDAMQSLKGGVAYLEWLLDRFGGDPILALAAYKAGEDAIREHQGVPLLADTRAYVPKVIAGFQVARVLCLTPPELYSDGCVFDLKGGNND